MKKFEMCSKCRDEYRDPANRRYHTQPIACHNCGPQLTLFDRDLNILENPIQQSVELIKSGKILAIKGVGGYHLVCDSSSVELLRERKNRADKPFALMVRDIEMAREIAQISPKESELLQSHKAPIVLLYKNSDRFEHIASEIDQIGLMLPYTPLYYLLLKELDSPLVVTSANRKGEPLCTADIEEIKELWDYCLDNDRDIINGCDDSVVFVEDEEEYIIRPARGYTPMQLPTESRERVLALGANQKSTVTIAYNKKAILSPYLGDLDSLKSQKYYRDYIERFSQLYRFEPEVVLHDKHPNYYSSQYAKEYPNRVAVQHHYAHAMANRRDKFLAVTFDGTGYGDDGTIWGGEFLLCQNGEYKRVAYFKPFKLIGAEKAIREPRRVALSFLFELYSRDILLNLTFSEKELDIFYKMWQNSLNSPLTSSCARVFDSVASLLDLVHINSYEAKSGLVLQSLYDESIRDFYPFSTPIIDFSEIVKEILKERDKRVAVSKFMNTLVEIIASISRLYDREVVLGGGVFQNRVLLRLIKRKIPNAILPKIANDSIISYGQSRINL
jgi:hydrogenase maturation protein HypF